LLGVLNHEYDRQNRDEESATMPLAGGIMQHGYQCGMIWGAALAAGAQAYRQYGPGPIAEGKAIYAAQRLVESFHAQNKNINCMEITDIDKSSTGMELIMYFLIKGGSIGCLRRAARYAPVALEAINTSFSEQHLEAPSPPVSCAGMLAKRMGLSERHTVMAAGLAGGIGLCGGACGALGAAIWILSMKISKEEDGKVDFNDPRANNLIERFMKSTDYEFECSKIVGRKFENVNDHAAYMSNGGCSEILEVLAGD
jgi:hypothetical protein